MGWQPTLARELRPLQLDALPDACPDSHGPLWERRAICPGPGNPSTEPVSGSCAGQAGWGAGWAVRSSAPSLGLWHPDLAEGILGTLV